MWALPVVMTSRSFCIFQFALCILKLPQGDSIAKCREEGESTARRIEALDDNGTHGGATHANHHTLPPAVWG
jgi:hypothetical protein